MNIIQKEEALKLVDLELDILLSKANKIREHYFGNKIELCAIINAKSMACGMDCRFCAQSSHNQAQASIINLFDDSNQLPKIIDDFLEYPIKHCGIITSCNALNHMEVHKLADIIQQFPSEKRKRLCTSLGRLSGLELSNLQSVGLMRYHNDLESSKKHFASICTTKTWNEQLATVKAAQSLGLEVCCGGLFGIGESWEDRIDFALTLANEGITNIPINFFKPQQGLPFGKFPTLLIDEALRIIAIFRHIHPSATIRICSGRKQIFGNEDHKIFAAGANAMMINDRKTPSPQDFLDDLEMINRAGMTVEI